MSPFSFLQTERPAIFEASTKAEAAVHPEPRMTCVCARRALEPAVTSPQPDEFLSLLEDVYPHALA